MPGQSLGDFPGAKMKQTDGKRKARRQLQFMPTLRIEQMRDAMRLEIETPGHGQQFLICRTIS